LDVGAAEDPWVNTRDATQEGWARYIAADVAVIDTSTGTRADLSALETALDGRSFLDQFPPGD